MIDFQDVGKDYPDGARAVGNVTLRAESGSITVLVGSSGSGKTTLLRMVNRLVDPTRGRILLDGRDVAERNPVELRRSIGYVMQASGLLPHRTVLQNVETVPLLNGASKQEARSAAMEQLERVGLDAKQAARYPSQLSGGQQQRVGVARGLAADPAVLLMDEPFGAVDPLVRAELQRELVQLQAELRKTIVFVTHDMTEALSLGDTVVVMRSGDAGGEVVQAAPPRELVAKPADDFVRRFIGVGNPDTQLEATPAAGGEIITDRFGRYLGTLPAAGLAGERGAGS